MKTSQRVEAAVLLSGGVREALWAQPVIRALPGVTVFAPGPAIGALVNLPSVSRAFSLDRSPADWLRAYAWLRRAPSRLAVMPWPGGPARESLVYFAGVPHRLVGGARQWLGTEHLGGLTGLHPVDVNRRLVAAALRRELLQPEADDQPAIEPELGAARRMQAFLNDIGIHSISRTLMLIPGGGNWSRRPVGGGWPEERFAVVANQVASSTVILVSGKGDEARVRETRAGIGLPTVVLDLARVTVEEFAIVAGGSLAVIGHDGDALHVAAAAGVPVVGLLKPGDIQPVGRSSGFLRADDLAVLPALPVIAAVLDRLRVDSYA